MTVNLLVWNDMWNMELGFTFSALLMVIHLVMDVIVLVIVGFDA